MPGALREAWAMWEELARVSELVTAPRRLEEVERFREEILELCGEEPRLTRFTHDPVRSPEDLCEIALTDYLHLHLKARHAAVYRYASDRSHFECLASFGKCHSPMPADWLLPMWLCEHGALLRGQLSLTDLSAGEAGRLFMELDILEAELIVPIGIEEGLWGLVVVGPSLTGHPYHLYDMLWLSLYGWKLWRYQSWHAQGLPTKRARQAQEEHEAFQARRALWENLKPSPPLKLLLVEEMPQVVTALTSWFTELGFAVEGCLSEREALAKLELFSPQLIVLDLSLHRVLPLEVLKAINRLLPPPGVIGTTTGEYLGLDAADARALAQEFGVRAILRKPCSLDELSRAVLEAALQRCLIAPESSAHAGPGGG